MNKNALLARQLAFSTSFHFPDILCQIEKLDSLRFPGDKIEKILLAAMNLSQASRYSLDQAVNKMISPFTKKTRHVPDLENLMRK